MATDSMQPPMARWLILVHRIPPRPLYLRAKMRQRLSAAGAIAVKNSVYLLPQGDEAVEDFEWIAQEITAGGGDAHLFVGEFLDPQADAAAVAQFRQARETEYRQLTRDARALSTSLRSGATTLVQTHERLTRRLEQVRRLDFFEAKGRANAERVIAGIASRLERGEKSDTDMRTTRELKGRTWVTRPGVKVDRIGSAWFIRRFIDAKARFRFEDPKTPRRAGDVRFDMVGGEFTHEGERCTLETLIHRIGLPDTGVQAIAEIVHDIDLKDSKFGRAETAGVSAAIDGLAKRHAADPERITHGIALFDDLYEAFRPGKKAQR
jgi:hypothetical protein